MTPGSQIGKIGTVVCWLQGAAWAATWWWPESAGLRALLEPIVGHAGRADAFGTAPFIRDETTIKRGFFAIAIAALVAPSYGACWVQP